MVLIKSNFKILVEYCLSYFFIVYFDYNCFYYGVIEKKIKKEEGVLFFIGFVLVVFLK